MQDDHEGKSDKKFTIICQFTATAELKKNKFIGSIVISFFPNGLNERKKS